MVEARRIADVMGGAQVLGQRIRSVGDLSEAVAKGLPKSALRNTVRRVFPDAGRQQEVMFRVVPEATFKRRRDRLSGPESERTERLARVVAAVEHIWDDSEEARRFLTAPHPLLRGKSPLQAAMTELGAREVEELLARIFHGIPA